MPCTIPWCLEATCNGWHGKAAPPPPSIAWPAKHASYEPVDHGLSDDQIRRLLAGEDVPASSKIDCCVRAPKPTVKALAAHLMSHRHCPVCFQALMVEEDRMNHLAFAHGYAMAPCHLFGIKWVVGAPKWNFKDDPMVACNWWWVESIYSSVQSRIPTTRLGLPTYVDASALAEEDDEEDSINDA